MPKYSGDRYFEKVWNETGYCKYIIGRPVLLEVGVDPRELLGEDEELVSGPIEITKKEAKRLYYS